MTAPQLGREVEHVPFRDGEILAVQIAGKPFVVLRPAVENLGLSYPAQWRKLQDRSWATVAQAATVGADGRIRDMAVVDIRTFLMLLATINETQVAATVRPLLIAYQREVADAIEAHFTRRATVAGTGYFTPRTLTLDETCAVLEQHYGLSYNLAGLTRALRNVGILKHTSVPRRRYRHLFWFTGSAWTVHPHVIAQIARRLDRAETQMRAFGAVDDQLELEGVVGSKSLAVTS